MGARESRERTWRTSSHSTNNGDCVEIAWRTDWAGPTALVRDSKNPSGGSLTVTDLPWRALLNRLSG